MMLATLLGIAFDTTRRIAIPSHAGWEMVVRAHVYMHNVIIGGECGWIRLRLSVVKTVLGRVCV